MERVIETLMENVQNPKGTLPSTPLLSNMADQFHGIREKTILIRKQKVYLKGRRIFVRRVFVRDENAFEYRFVGWVVDEDCDFCFICVNEFSLLNRRHHCRVCGDLVCEDCSSGSVLLSEYYYYGHVRACNHCYFGQEECSVSIQQSPDQTVSRYRHSIDISSQKKGDMGEMIRHSHTPQLALQNTAVIDGETASFPSISPLPQEQLTTHVVDFSRDEAVDVELNIPVAQQESLYNRDHPPSVDATVLKYTGYPFCVLKTRIVNSGDKVFVNVCFHSTIPGLDIVIGENCPHTAPGKNGDLCFVYDVCVGKAALDDDVTQADTNYRILRLLNNACRAKLEENFTIPKIKKSFKGDHTPMFIQTEGIPANLFAAETNQEQNGSNGFTVLKDDASVGVTSTRSNTPAGYTGWVLREEGNVIRSFKKRYMVLDSGVITCYTSDSPGKDTADENRPRERVIVHGIGKIAEFDLRPTSVLELIEGRGKAPLTPTQLYIRDVVDGRVELMVDTECVEDHSGWVQAILLHMEYIKHP